MPTIMRTPWVYELTENCLKKKEEVFFNFKNELKIATDYRQVAVFVVFVVDLAAAGIRA